MNLSCITDQINQDIFVACRILKQHHYSNIEIHAINHKSVEDFEEDDLTQIEQAVIQYDMNVIALASTVFMMTPCHHDDIISDFSPAFYKIEGSIEYHLEQLKKVCQIANRLSCKVVRLFPFRAPDQRVVLGTPSDFDMIIQHVKRAVEIAKDFNITLVVENCPHSYLPKGNMTFDLVKAINSPHLRLLYDPGNSFRANKDRVPHYYLNTTIMEELTMISSWIKHIHIKDYKYSLNYTKPFRHVAFDEGDVPIKDIIKHLKSINFDDYISCEPEVRYHDTIKSLDTLSTIARLVLTND